MSNATIRAKIRPFPRVATYPTSWTGPLSFEQIYDDLVHYVTNFMKRRGFHRTNHLPDCIQHGFMALWLELIENKDFLTTKTRQQAVFFILARCKISSLRYYDDKFDPLESLVRDDWRNNWDEHAITGLSSSRSWWNVVERWAPWAADVDIRIDLEQIMRKLAEKYAHSFKHLVALYAVTTQVTRKDAAALVGIKAWNFHKTYAEPMLQEVQYEFAQVFLERHSYTLPERQSAERPSNAPYQDWRVQYQRGHTAPAKALLEQYHHTICISGAIRAQIDGKTYRQAALDMGRNPNTFPKYMKRAARMLSAAYA
jgi:hypothetical protein